MIPNITAGETINYTQSFSDYDPASDTLVFDLVTDGANETITATDNGDGNFLVSVAYGTTDGWKPGTYHYQAHITSGSDRYYVEQGSFEVSPKFSDMPSGHDNRSHVKKVLDALEAMLENKATQDQLSYTIGNRSLSRMSPTELREWYDDYKARYQREIAAERIAQGLGNSNKIRVRM